MTLCRTYGFCALPRSINPIVQCEPRNWRKIGQRINCKSFKIFDILSEVFNINSGRLVHVTWGNFIFVVCFENNGLEVDVFRVVVI